MAPLSIIGVIKKGIGVASETLKSQMPLIVKEYTQIKNCHHGTINVSLQESLIIANPDYVTQEIEWKSGIKERFAFKKVKIVLNSNSYNAWIYIAFNSPHRQNLKTHEIITEKINCEHGDWLKVELSINKKYSKLHYAYNIINIV